ncbi:MAG: TonB-dependent receptor domain-containing protein, partial [Flavobacteriaceae bacterium]
STRLGENEQWGIFPSIGVGADLNKYLQLEGVDLLKVRVGYGVTGALPGQNGLTQTVRRIDNGVGGSVSSPLERAANPDLKWEEKAETNFGIEYRSGRLGAVIDIYSRDISDFIINREVDASVYGFDRRFENAGKIKTNGFELALNYDVVSSDKLNYNTGIVFSTYKSILEEYVGEERGLADNSNMGAPGQNDTETILVAVGEEIGQIWGPVYAGTTTNGSQDFVDLNGGGLNIDGDPLADDSDMQVLGKGIPDFELGWTNQLSFGRWSVNAFFRGAFGHSLINTNRNFYEPRVGSQGFYNLVNTKYADDNITNARFSSLYVEKADFFRLDNLTVGYDLDTSNINGIDAIGLSLNAQNVFTITDYTGVDPDPSLSDRGPVANGDPLGQINDPLVPGIDRRYNYFNQRSFTIGLNVKF